MKYLKTTALSFFIVGSLFSCQPNTGQNDADNKNIASIPANLSEPERANLFFEQSFEEMLNRQPMYLSYLGIKKEYDKWDDISDEKALEDHEIIKRQLKTLNEAFDYKKLDRQTQLSYKLFKAEAEKKIALFKYRFHNYPVNQEEGLHTEIPTFLINVHSVDSLPDAKAYIARLQKIKPLFDQLITNLKLREKKGIIPPKFVFPLVIESCRNIISGKPFDNSEEENTVLEDITAKINALNDIDEQTKKTLIADASFVLEESVKPAYENLINYLQKLQAKANDTAGAWKLPDGNDFYAQSIKKYTTTELSPEEVFALGEKEVARIHKEIKTIMKKVKFRNDNIQDFFRFMTTDEQFYYPNTETGRKAYLAQAEAYITNIKTRLDELFITKPKAELVVKRVEAFREKSTGSAFYDHPTPDGSRPGRFYVNLYDMTQVPVYQLEALAYHEGAPGHHMQIAIAQDLTSLPKFRRFGHYTAYSEGWGLYTELVPKEMGLYTDPYQDFGRLSMELLRAARLVVDPGIHYKKWTREQAIDYFIKNTAEPAGECVKAIDRYIVWPGQATAYKVGMNKILELRKKAKSQLGNNFDIREFHDVLLTSGPVPLNIMEEIVDDWIKTKKS